MSALSVLVFFLVWTNPVPEIFRCSYPPSWYLHIITLSLIGYFPLLHTIKLKIKVQGDVLITILGFLVFSNIAIPIDFHFHQCEIFFPERILSGATQTEWKETELSDKIMGKGLHKVFKVVLK